MITHVSNTDVKTKNKKKRWKVYLFVLWSKLICNKNQFSRFKWALLKKPDQQLVEDCLHLSSFTKISWHQSTTLIAICPMPLLIIHCGIDPQRGMGGFGKIGLFCSLVYFCSSYILSYSSQLYCNISRKETERSNPSLHMNSNWNSGSNTAWMLDWCLLHILVWRSHGVTTPTCWHPVPTYLHSGTKRSQLPRSTTVFAPGVHKP